MLLERSKESYHFYDNYQKIENEYEHLEGEKKLVQCYIEKSLNNIRINISKFNTHFLQSLIDDNKYLTKKKSENIEEFFQCNFKNAHDYVFLSNHSEIVNDEIFSDIFYNVYKKISKRFLSPLVFETNTKVPEFISRELDNAILNINGVLCQKNASLFSLKSFYKLNGTEMAKSKRVNDYESQRLFIYKSDNADFEVETNEVDFKPPTGLNQATKVMNIPIFLWLLEWHEQNGIKVRFISEEEAKKKQYSANDINTLDFSITHIKKPNNKFIDIVLQINDIPHKEAFYNMDINYYSMTAFTTKEYENDTGECQDASHYNFFNKLWEQAESINGTIREKFFAGKFYSNLDNDKKTAIKDIIDRIYPVIS